MTISSRDLRIKLANAGATALKAESGEAQVPLTADEIDILINALGESLETPAQFPSAMSLRPDQPISDWKADVMAQGHG